MPKLHFRTAENPSLWATGVEARYLVLTGENWRHHYPTPPPEADFTRSIYIVAQRGIQPSAGYYVKIRDINQNKDTIAVQVETAEPSLKQEYAQVLTNPITVAEVTKSELKQAGSLNFIFIDRKGKLLSAMNVKV